MDSNFKQDNAVVYDGSDYNSLKNVDSVDKSDQFKKFWEKPEGTLGMVVAILLGLAAIFGLSAILPFIIGLLANTIFAGVLFAIVAAIVYVISDKKFRTLFGYMYKNAMRTVTDWAIDKDPIGMLKSYVDDLKNNLETMDGHIRSLKGQIRQLGNVIEDNDKNLKDNLNIADVARKKGIRTTFVLKAREAGRLRESNLTLQTLYQKMEYLYRVLRKVYEATEVTLKDLESEIDVKTREYNAMRSGHSALKNAMSILRGQGTGKEIYDRAMEKLVEDFGQRAGEMEDLLEVSKSFIESVDLKNGVYEEDAIKMFEEWEKKADSMLISPADKALLKDISDDPNEILDFNSSLSGKTSDMQIGIADSSILNEFFPTKPNLEKGEQ